MSGAVREHGADTHGPVRSVGTFRAGEGALYSSVDFLVRGQGLA